MSAGSPARVVSSMSAAATRTRMVRSPIPRSSRPVSSKPCGRSPWVPVCGPLACRAAWARDTRQRRRRPGNRVAYVIKDQIWSTTADARTPATQLTHTRGHASGLRWSPDGNRLAFVSDRGSHSFIGVYECHGAHADVPRSLGRSRCSRVVVSRWPRDRLRPPPRPHAHIGLWRTARWATMVDLAGGSRHRHRTRDLACRRRTRQCLPRARCGHAVVLDGRQSHRLPLGT